MHKKLRQFVFYNNRTPKLVNRRVTIRGRDPVNSVNMNFIQIDANIANSFSRFLIDYSQQSIEFHRLKS